MRAQYGWEVTSWFGGFVTLAAGMLGCAFAFLCVSWLLIVRYEARLADGDIHPPALRLLDDSRAPYVLGASIADIPVNGRADVLQAALRQTVSRLPWGRMLLRRRASKSGVQLVTLFFPVNGIEAAFALCARLANVPPSCTPSVVQANELSLPNGKAVNEMVLRQLGIAPYAPPRGRTRVVSLPAPQRRVREFAAQQPPLALRQGVGRALPGIAAKTYWLSTRYRPADPGIVDVVAAGDVMMGSIGLGLNPEIRRGTDAARLVGAKLAGIFRHADIAFANLEGPLYDGPEPSPKDCANCFAFHSPPYYAGVLASLGIDAVSLANNHSGDYGEAGRESTMKALRAHGIGYGGLDRDGARAANLILPDGRKVAVTAFAPNNGTLNLNNIADAKALVRRLKRTHDLVIVSFHGGAEGWDHVHVPHAEEYYYGEDRGNVEAFAHAVIDAGADLVIGQGPHVPRAVEIYRDHLIAYSLGNFWTYAGVNNYAVSGLGPVLEAWLAPDGKIAGFTVHSTRQAGLGVPRIDPLDEAGRYVLYLTRSDFPGTARRLEHAAPLLALGQRPTGPGS